MQIQVDLLTDVRCPFSFISQVNLEKAIENLGLPPGTPPLKRRYNVVCIYILWIMDIASQ